MLLTMLNLLPIGQLDGGHIAHVLLGERIRTILAFVSIILMLFTGYWFMALIAILLMRVRHPEPLDAVSKLSRGRKLATLTVVLMFVLSVAPLAPFF